MLAEGSLLGSGSTAQLFEEHYPENGYGWFVRPRGGSKRVSISGRSPGFGSSWQRLVDEDVTVIVLGNLYNGVPATIATGLLDMALGEDVAPSKLRSSPPTAELVAGPVGTYQFGPDFYRANALVRIQARDGHLFNGQSWLIPAGDTSDATFVHRTYWSTLTFERDESGKAQRLRYDDFVGTRVKSEP